MVCCLQNYTGIAYLQYLTYNTLSHLQTLTICMLSENEEPEYLKGCYIGRFGGTLPELNKFKILVALWCILDTMICKIYIVLYWLYINGVAGLPTFENGKTGRLVYYDDGRYSTLYSETVGFGNPVTYITLPTLTVAYPCHLTVSYLPYSIYKTLQLQYNTYITIPTVPVPVYITHRTTSLHTVPFL